MTRVADSIRPSSTPGWRRWSNTVNGLPKRGILQAPLMNQVSNLSHILLAYPTLRSRSGLVVFPLP